MSLSRRGRPTAVRRINVDLDLWCQRLPDFGWSVCTGSGQVLSRPFDDPGQGDAPPEGARVGGKGDRAYVYDLVRVGEDQPYRHGRRQLPQGDRDQALTELNTAKSSVRSPRRTAPGRIRPTCRSNFQRLVRLVVGNSHDKWASGAGAGAGPAHRKSVRLTGPDRHVSGSRSGKAPHECR